jgi:hypothetical protein
VRMMGIGAVSLGLPGPNFGNFGRIFVQSISKPAAS